MSSIPQTTDNGNSVSDFATKFMQRFHLGKLLFKCNAGKEKGIPVMDVFRFLFCMMFSDRSFYMQMKTGTFGEGFSKNTIYRFLNNARTNWQRFTTLLSADIINGFMKPLTDEKRKDVFIVDDSLFDRSRSKKTELLARVFDHCSMKYRAGFRMLTLGWSDGNSFVPVSHCLLSAAEDKNLLCEGNACDGRSLAGRRRLQARRKATDVMVELIHSARCAGITARYVLFDSWFSAPKTMIALKNQEHLDTIAMVKKSKTKYLYNGEKLNVKEIYSRNKKRRGRSRYLLSVSVTVEKDGESIPAKFVYVRNKSKRKDWLVIVSTDTGLSEEGLSSKMCKFIFFLTGSFQSCRFCMPESILFILKNACLHLVIHSQLVANQCPVGYRAAIPFFIQFHNPQVECLAYSSLIGECPFFCDFTKA